MQKLFFVFCIVVLAIACNNEKPATAETKAATPQEPVTYAITPSYSSSFEIGNAAYGAMIVKGSWKDWEDNTMDNMKSWCADTIVAVMADNMIATGVDSLQARWKRGRTSYTNVIDTVHSVISVRSTDKNENWVLIWAKEINTNTKGVKDTSELMETWRINKDGKADWLLQYDRHHRKQ